MLLSFIAGYILLTIYIGRRAASKVNSAKDFALAGRNLPTYMVAAGLFATWFGSETVMGSSAEFLSHGVHGMIQDPLGAALCLLLAGVLIAKPLYKYNILTFCDFFGKRFNKRTELISAIIIVPSYFTWISAQLLAMAMILHSIAGLPVVYGIVLCSLVVVAYTYGGGMWAVSITDTIQTLVILLGMFVLMIDLALQVDGWSAVQQTTRSIKPDFWRFWPHWNWESITTWLAALITIGLGSIPQQDIFQRVMGARSEKSAIHGTYWSALMYLTVGLMPLMIALLAKTLYGNQVGAMDAQQVLPDVVLHHTGLVVQIIFFGALLSAILSTTSGAILAPSTIIGENIIPAFKKNLSDQQLLRIMRWSVVGVAFIASVLATLSQSIHDLVGASSVFSLVSLFVPMIAGLYFPSTNAYGATAAMVGGLMAWGVAEWVQSALPSLYWGVGGSVLCLWVGNFWGRANTIQPPGIP